MSDSRDRIVAGAADMLRRRGYNATSVRELAKHAQAPLGSTYHYFPGGKTELVTEAVRFTDRLAAAHLGRQLEAGPVVGLRAFVDMWRGIVVDSDFGAGCPVLAVAVEDTDDEPRRAAAEAFQNWVALLAQSMSAHGINEVHARQLANLTVAAIEGAVAMCRAQRSTQPLDDAHAQLEQLVQSAIIDR